MHEKGMKGTKVSGEKYREGPGPSTNPCSITEIIWNSDQSTRAIQDVLVIRSGLLPLSAWVPQCSRSRRWGFSCWRWRCLAGLVGSTSRATTCVHMRPFPSVPRPRSNTRRSVTEEKFVKTFAKRIDWKCILQCCLMDGEKSRWFTICIRDLSSFRGSICRCGKRRIGLMCISWTATHDNASILTCPPNQKSLDRTFLHKSFQQLFVHTCLQICCSCLKYSAEAWLSPPSPCIGSINTPATGQPFALYSAILLWTWQQQKRIGKWKWDGDVVGTFAAESVHRAPRICRSICDCSWEIIPLLSTARCFLLVPHLKNFLFSPSQKKSLIVWHTALCSE